MTQLAPVTVPPDVATLALAHDLGAHHDTFPPNKRLRIIIPFAILVVLFLLMTAVLAPAAGSNWLVLAVMFGFFVALFLAGLVYGLVTSPLVSARVRARKTYVFERGFVHVGRDGTEVCRWDAVRTVWQTIVQMVYNGISTGTNYAYRLQLADGRLLKLNTMSTDMATFGPLIQHEVANAQLPQAFQAIKAGQTLAFGPLAVSSGGIAVGGKAGLPWNEVKDVQLVQGAVRVMQQGKKVLAYGSVQASNVPNLGTFMALTRQLTQGRAS